MGFFINNSTMYLFKKVFHYKYKTLLKFKIFPNLVEDSMDLLPRS